MRTATGAGPSTTAPLSGILEPGYSSSGQQETGRAPLRLSALLSPTGLQRPGAKVQLPESGNRRNLACFVLRAICNIGFGAAAPIPRIFVMFPVACDDCRRVLQ